MLLRRRSVNVMVLQEAPRGESPAFFLYHRCGLAWEARDLGHRSFGYWGAAL